MKRTLFLMLGLLLTTMGLQAQGIVNKEALEQNHSGMLEASKNNNGRAVYFEFVHVSTDKAAYKWDDAGATRGSIRYMLKIYRDAAKTDLILAMPVKMRNLITTYYVDVVFNKADLDDENLREKSAQMIFKKDVRWARTKFVPHMGCAWEDGNWERIDRVESFDQLLNYLVRQLDQNVKFSCYR